MKGPGIFKQASEDILSKRSFKKAKRRTDNTSSTDIKSNPFSSFGGFGATTFGGVVAKPGTTTNTIKSTADTDKENKKKPDLTSFWKSSQESEDKDYFATRSENKDQDIKSTDIKIINNNNNNNEASVPEKKSEMTEQNNDAYFEQLISLNHSVLSWMREHFDKNPCIDLTPVFKDYEKHLKDLELKYAPKKKITFSSAPKVESTAGNVFKTPDSTHASPIISAGAATTKVSSLFVSSTPIQQTSVFGNVPKLNSGNLFSASPFVTTNNDAKKAEVKEEISKKDMQEEDGETEPVPERKTIVEQDAFYQIRCKLFFKKGAQWQELGIGMVYLKPCNGKTQLLIRMETATGNILLNITISSEMPISRSGKNNVMLVSIPNPPVYTKPADGDNTLPCTYLIRVKGTTEADELLEKLKPN